MNRETVQGFFNELQAIEKDAGLKDALKKVKQVPETVKRLGHRAISHPHAIKIINHLSQPSNTADLAHSIANIASKLT